MVSTVTMNIGRPVSAARFSRYSGVALLPAATTKIPRPASFSGSTSARSSPSSQIVEGIGRPPQPLWLGENEDAKPAAPVWSASRTMACILRSSSGVGCFLLEASSPITALRIVECPASTPTFAYGCARSSASRYCGKVSKFQRVPSSSAWRSMPSTTDRFFSTVSRSRAGQGAMPKPQLPRIAVVTPSAGDGESVGSQVICAS